MKLNQVYVVALGLLASLLVACNDLTVGREPANSHEANFDLLWQEFDRMYGQFTVKQIDWDKAYERYRPKIQAGMTDDALFDLIAQMLGELNDGHVWMLKPGPNYRRYDSGPTYSTADFSWAVTKSYVQDVYQLSTADGVNVVWGKLAGNIGYLHFIDLGQSPKFYEKAMDKALTELADTRGLVVDVRNLAGGDDRSGQLIASRFAAARQLYMTTRFRNGPRHADFTASTEWYVEPTSRQPHYDKPVMLLTNRLTQSAGETFTLAMNQTPAVTQIGDITFGVFSDNPKRELPNGWIYALSSGDFRAADGRSYEGLGIAPKISVINTPADIAAGRDVVLTKAIDLLIH